VQVRKNLPANFQKLTSVGEQETHGIQSEPMPHGKKAKILSSSAKKKTDHPYYTTDRKIEQSRTK